MKEWHKYFHIGEVHYQLDWGDHPRTGDWTTAWSVFRNTDGERVTKRCYSRKKDAERGAAQIYNAMEKALLR